MSHNKYCCLNHFGIYIHFYRCLYIVKREAMIYNNYAAWVICSTYFIKVILMYIYNSKHIFLLSIHLVGVRVIIEKYCFICFFFFSMCPSWNVIWLALCAFCDPHLQTIMYCQIGEYYINEKFTLSLKEHRTQFRKLSLKLIIVQSF